MTPFEITVEEFKKLQDDTTAEYQLIDVREPNEFATANIGGTLIPMRTLPQHFNDLRDDVPLVIMCHIGGRSTMAAEFLRRNGFENAQSLAGGIEAWSQRIDPKVPKY